MTFSTIAKTFASGAVALLVLGLAPMAKAQCTVGTLVGSFVRVDSGFVISQPSNLPLAGVHLMTFDGNGRFVTSGSSSLNGNVSESTSTGTYRVNSDCTGTYASVGSNGRTGTAFFVVTNSGNEIHIVPTNTGSTINCIARKVFTAGNQRN